MPLETKKVKPSPLISEQHFVIREVAGLCSNKHRSERIRSKCWRISKQVKHSLWIVLPTCPGVAVTLLWSRSKEMVVPEEEAAGSKTSHLT